MRPSALRRARLLRRALRRRPRPVGLRDQRVRAGEVRRDDRGAGGPALRQRAGDRLLDRRAHAAARDPRRRPARDRRRRGGARPRPRPRPAERRLRAARGARGVPRRRLRPDRDAPRSSTTSTRPPSTPPATRSSARSTASCSPSTGGPSAPRYPFTGDEVHERLDGALRPARLQPRATDKYNLDRFDRMRLADRRRRARRAGRRARLPRGRRRRRRDAPHARADASPTPRPPLSKEFLRGELDDDELPIEPAELVREPTASTVRLGAEAETLDPAARTVAARQRRDAALRRVRARHRRRADAAAGPGRDRGVGADAAQPRHARACCATGREQAEQRDRDRLGLHRLRGRRLAGACAGCKVTLVTDEAIPHEARLGEEAGRRIQGWLEELGVDAACSAPASRRSATTPCTCPGATR